MSLWVCHDVSFNLLKLLNALLTNYPRPSAEIKSSRKRGLRVGIVFHRVIVFLVPVLVLSCGFEPFSAVLDLDEIWGVHAVNVSLSTWHSATVPRLGEVVVLNTFQQT